MLRVKVADSAYRDMANTCLGGGGGQEKQLFVIGDICFFSTNQFFYEKNLKADTEGQFNEFGTE